MMYEALTTMTLFEANVAVPKSALKSILTAHERAHPRSMNYRWRFECESVARLLQKLLFFACELECVVLAWWRPVEQTNLMCLLKLLLASCPTLLRTFSALFLWCICCNVWDTMELGFVPTCFAWQSTIGGLTKYKTDNNWSHLTNPSTEQLQPLSSSEKWDSLVDSFILYLSSLLSFSRASSSPPRRSVSHASLPVEDPLHGTSNSTVASPPAGFTIQRSRTPLETLCGLWIPK